MPKEITIRRWFDRHLHIRDGELMANVLPCTINQRATGALIMPNLQEPVSTITRATEYEKRIKALIPPGSDFQPKLALYLTDDTKPVDVVSGFEANLWRAVKMYFAASQGHGGTTGSDHGVTDLEKLYPVFATMEKHGIPLLGHFEAVGPDVDEFDREIRAVGDYLIPILRAFPGLKVVFEHITDHRAADFVAEAEYNIRATVTAHHLLYNRNSLFQGGLNPGYYCKPVLKRAEHQLRVRQYVTSGHPRFGAGTDSAPHDLNAKTRCYGCAAGIFTAPAAVELYTMAFAEDQALIHLESFLSVNFLDFYGVEPSAENMTLAQAPWRLPETVGNVPVFRGGKVLHWQLVS